MTGLLGVTHEQSLERWAQHEFMPEGTAYAKLVDMHSHDLACEFDNALTIKYVMINLRMGTEIINALNLTVDSMTKSYRVRLNIRNDYQLMATR